MAYVKYNPNPKSNKAVDCSVRALCATTSKSWTEVYDLLCAAGREMYDMPDSADVIRKVLTDLGFVKVTCKVVKGQKRPTPKSLCVERPTDTIVAFLAGHVVGIVKGDICDLWDCGDKCVYQYWVKPAAKTTTPEPSTVPHSEPLSVTELKALWIGKTFRAYDSWNGDSRCFIIDDIKRLADGGVRLSHTNEYGNTVKYCLSPEMITALVDAGCWSRTRTVDGCRSTVRIAIRYPIQ